MEAKTSQEPTKIKRGWKVWLVYFMLAFFSYILNVAGPAVAYLRDEINLSFTQSGLHTSALALGLIAMGIFGHFALKRLPEWKALGIGGIGMGLGGLLLVLGNQPAMTLTGLFIMGAVGAFIVATNPAILADEMGNRSPIGVSEANTLSSLLSILAPVAVGFFASRAVTWRPAVYIVTTLAFLIGVWILVAPQFSWKITKSREFEFTKNKKLPGKVWLFWTVLVVSVSIEFCLIYWASDYLQAHLAMTKDSATQWVSLFLVGMVIGRYAGSLLLKKYDRFLILFASVAVGASGYAIFWLSGSQVVALLGLLLAGLGVANFYATSITLIFDAAGPARAAAGSVATLASGVAIFSLPFALGSLADLIGMRQAMLLVAILFVILAILVMYGKKVIDENTA
jgi:MFS family permease